MEMPLANNQADMQETPKRFRIVPFLATIPEPDPTTYERHEDPAFRWRRLPHVFSAETYIYRFRKAHGAAFQFDWDDPKHARLDRPDTDGVGFVIRVRRNPHAEQYRAAR